MAEWEEAEQIEVDRLNKLDKFPQEQREVARIFADLADRLGKVAPSEERWDALRRLVPIRNAMLRALFPAKET